MLGLLVTVCGSLCVGDDLSEWVPPAITISRALSDGSAVHLLCLTMPPSSIEDRYSFNRVRNRALKELAKLILVPPLVLNALTRSTQTRLGYWTVPCYALAIFLGAYARTWYHDYLQGMDAKAVSGEGTIGTIPR